jgi:hypothetical protein
LTAMDLRHADRTAGLWTTEDVETVGEVGKHSDIAIDSDDALHIAYWDETGRSVRHATGTTGAWTTSVIDDGGDIPGAISIAIGPGDKEVVTYRNDVTDQLMIASRVADTWMLEPFGAEGRATGNTAVAIDDHGRIHVAFTTPSGVDYVRLHDGTVDSTSILGATLGEGSSLAVTADGVAHIVWSNGTNVGYLSGCL